ncbi:NADPH-dependent oxidoreductase [Pseudanabaena sp. UWO310]|uniref:NADPH-dependent oxidoreductase n=1 Tax=Pseudanabaena sp. UWO310 TaxID=2480795 RepID=UPI001159150E|nr:NADPH-dependent oxidoreductase [Pseudanabaena sp. UWO310]TYQ25919.1 NADPH-dependent oxidoreductase [Pseudanabaena sp. UWO310]
MTTTTPKLAATDLLHDRYGSSFPEDFLEDFLWNEHIRNLLVHRSVRSYLSKPLPKGTLETLIAAAQSAASSSNLQLWSVVAVEDPARKERLSVLARNQAHIRQVPLFLVWLADLSRARNIAQSRNSTSEGLEYLETFLTGAIDASLAAQNAVVAAESLGLGTVYVGAIRNNPEAVAKELNLPPLVFPAFGLSVGYPDPDNIPIVKPRLGQSAVLHREEYSTEAQEEAIAEYDQIMTDFYQQQQTGINVDWSTHSTARIATAAALGGRDRLTEVLHNLGFAIR